MKNFIVYILFLPMFITCTQVKPTIKLTKDPNLISVWSKDSVVISFNNPYDVTTIDESGSKEKLIITGETGTYINTKGESEIPRRWYTRNGLIFEDTSPRSRTPKIKYFEPFYGYEINGNILKIKGIVPERKGQTKTHYFHRE